MEQKRTHVIACADAWLKDAGCPTYTELLQKVKSMNATAAQPLDLDNEHIEKIWNSLDGKQIIAGENHLSWDAALRREFAKAIARDVLAQARAAQPESATGTTGAVQSIDTPEFSELLALYLDAAERAPVISNPLKLLPARDALIAHIDAIIGDLRAQLAAKGQSEPVRWEYRVKPSEGSATSWRETSKERAEWYRANPLVEYEGDGSIYEVRELYLSAPASAQPDRGAAQECQNCGRAPGERRDECEECPEAPASQPVAPSDWKPMPIQPTKEMMDAARLAWCITPGSAIEESYAAMWRAAPISAAAPSDAKGKADAANAGGLTDVIQQIARIAFQRMNILRENTDPALLEIRKIAKAAVNNQSTATSAADAKDAMRLDFMIQNEAWVAFGKDGESCRVFSRNDDGDAVPMLGWGARHWQHNPREAIDAAMAAAPSSAAGKEEAGGQS